MKKIIIFIFILFLFTCTKEQKKIIDREKELEILYTQIFKKNPFTKEINQTYRRIIKQIKKQSIENNLLDEEIFQTISFMSNRNITKSDFKKNVLSQKRNLKKHLVSLYIFDFIRNSTNTISSNAGIEMKYTHWEINKIMEKLALTYSILDWLDKKEKENEIKKSN